MFVACGIWCVADVSSVSPSSSRGAKSNHYGICIRRSAIKTFLAFRDRNDQTHI